MLSRNELESELDTTWRNGIKWNEKQNEAATTNTWQK